MPMPRGVLVCSSFCVAFSSTYKVQQSNSKLLLCVAKQHSLAFGICLQKSKKKITEIHHIFTLQIFGHKLLVNFQWPPFPRKLVS